MKTLVAVTRTNYGVEKAVKLAIELLGGVDNFISPGETVLLKPNLFNVEPPETGCTTDMRIVLATAELLKNRVVNVYLKNAQLLQPIQDQR